VRDPDHHRARAKRRWCSISRLYHRHELRCAELRGQDRAGARRDDGRHGDLLRRGGMIRTSAVTRQVVLPVHPVALWVQPAPLRLADACEFFIGRVQGRPRRAPDGPESDRPGRRDAFAAGRHRPALARTPPRLARAGRPGAEDQRDPPRRPTARSPIQLKLGAARVYDDVRMAAKTGPDSIYMTGWKAAPARTDIATRRPACRHRGDPPGRKALDDVGKTGEISLCMPGHPQRGDVAKALALGATRSRSDTRR